MARRHRNINVFILVLAVCTLATWAVGLSNLKYKSESTVAFHNGFPGDINQWESAGDWSSVDIGEEKITVHREADKRGFAKRRFVLPDDPSRADQRLRIRGVIQTNKRIINSADVRGAAYMLWLEDADGEILKYTTISNLTGNQLLYRAERILNIPDTVTAINVVMNTRESQSSFSLLDASVDMVSITPLYLLLVVMLSASWLLVAAVAAKWLLTHAPPRTALLAGLLGAGIIVGVMLPETFKFPLIDPLFQQLTLWIPLDGTESGKFTYKLGHFLFFFLTSLVLMLKTSSMPITRLQIVCIMVMMAVATEGMQLHLLNRSTQAFDIGVDAGGILLAWLAVKVLRPKPKRRKSTVWRRRRVNR